MNEGIFDAFLPFPILNSQKRAASGKVLATIECTPPAKMSGRAVEFANSILFYLEFTLCVIWQ
jgi:hypothetical protein